MCAIILEQGSHHLLVEGLVPFSAVVLELYILLGGLVLGTLDKFLIIGVHGTGEQL